MKSVKDLDLKTRWFDNDDIKVINDIKDLSLKVFWFEKMLIYLKRLLRAKKWIIKSKFDEKKND